ncbi:hypothetical protein [uncultured Aquimarina sp.]|uniref:hypothetical protein n=1 Tax=uncultured Aquimarina sp. TaxID=575652 RepID=UPI0026017FA1|nr:hypothetical protein [uncultured Aquimarina sp.]
MFKTIISSKRYWITVLRLGLIAMILLGFVTHIMEYGGITSDTFMDDKINNGRWVRYLISRAVGGLAYGMIQGYYFELRKHKSNR